MRAKLGITDEQTAKFEKEWKGFKGSRRFAEDDRVYRSFLTKEQDEKWLKIRGPLLPDEVRYEVYDVWRECRRDEYGLGIDPK